jgi:hypothetical protein
VRGYRQTGWAIVKQTAASSGWTVELQRADVVFLDRLPLNASLPDASARASHATFGILRRCRKVLLRLQQRRELFLRRLMSARTSAPVRAFLVRFSSISSRVMSSSSPRSTAGMVATRA